MRKCFSAGETKKSVRRVALQGRKERKVPFMKKVLMVVAMLLLATPVFAADVTITATTGTPVGNLIPVTIGWSGAAEANSIRGFALNLSVSGGCNLDNIRGFMVGESNQVNKGFGVFPGKFRQFIDVLSPTQSDWLTDTNYNPLAPAGDLNSSGGNDNPTMVVELGTLYQGDLNAPGTSGTLFVVDINMETFTSTTMCISLEQTRGGVVKKDGTAATVTLPGTGGCFSVSPCSYTVPNIVGLTRAQALSALAANNCVLGTEVNGFGGATAVNSVYAQLPAAGTSACPGPVSVNMSTAMYPIKATSSIYANWVTLGKPACWANPRQCHGDADGKKLGTQWVSGNDLTILKAAITKAQTAIGYTNGISGFCADFDHKKLGTQWVSGNDLAILKQYITKAETLIPVCGTPGVSDPNYWYFCIPTGVTCPAGVTCATAGVCPNTP